MCYDFNISLLLVFVRKKGRFISFVQSQFFPTVICVTNVNVLFTWLQDKAMRCCPKLLFLLLCHILIKSHKNLYLFIFKCSSPEPKAHGELIVW